jgi:hypothetical protein
LRFLLSFCPFIISHRISFFTMHCSLFLISSGFFVCQLWNELSFVSSFPTSHRHCLSAHAAVLMSVSCS